MRGSGEELRSKGQPASCEWRGESLIESFSLICALLEKTFCSSVFWWSGSDMTETGSKPKKRQKHKLGWRRWSVVVAPNPSVLQGGWQDGSVFRAKVDHVPVSYLEGKRKKTVATHASPIRGTLHGRGCRSVVALAH